jgi:hypothetical protein
MSSVVAGCYPGSGQETHTNHLAIDGATWQDNIQTASGQHLECIHWFDGKNSVVRNTRFLNCAQFDLSFQPDGFTPNANVSNFLLENNVLDAPCSHQSSPCGSNHATTFGCTAGEPAPTGLVIRYNSYPLNSDYPQLLEDPNFSGCFGTVQIYANVLGGPANSYVCDSQSAVGANYTNNVWSSSQSCGTNNLANANPSSLYTNPANYDYTLPNNSPAIDYIPTGISYPPTDITGTSRPQHGKADAGAYEHP